MKKQSRVRTAIAATGVLSAVFAAGQAVAQITSVNPPMTKPTLTITQTKIESVAFSGGLVHPCTGTGVSVVVNLAGSNKFTSAGQIQVVRYSSTNQVVTAPYSLGLSEKKTVTVAVPFTNDCTKKAPSKYTVKLVPTSGGWDGYAKDLNARTFTYVSGLGYHDNEIYGGPHPSRAKVNSPLKVNGGLLIDPVTSAVSFTASVTAGTAAAAGKVDIERSQVGSTGATTTSHVNVSYSVGAGATANVTVPTSGWGLSISAPLPSYFAVLIPTAGGYDGSHVTLTPGSVNYVMTSWNTATVESPG